MSCEDSTAFYSYLGISMFGESYYNASVHSLFGKSLVILVSPIIVCIHWLVSPIIMQVHSLFGESLLILVSPIIVCIHWFVSPIIVQACVH